MEHIIAKIDNDFNPDNSDWITRVPAWCVDAMGQLKVLRTEYKKRELTVNNRIAHSPCPITDSKGFVVYDKNGCKINSVNENVNCCTKQSSTGEENNIQLSPSNTVYETETDKNINYIGTFTEHVDDDDYNKRHRVYNLTSSPVGNQRNYIIVDANTIELNWDTDKIIIENLEIATIYSTYFDADIPVVPNNAILIEAICYYCMYKMLTRGMKHPVFNLAASQYGTNPYFMWNQLKDKAKASVIADMQEENGFGDDAWRSYFYNYTFYPKN